MCINGVIDECGSCNLIRVIGAVEVAVATETRGDALSVGADEIFRVTCYWL